MWAIAKQQVIRGTGSYVPTSPTFANVNILLIGSQIEDAAAIPNLQNGAIQFLGFLNTEPSLLWIFVRAYLPMMTEFYVGRHLMTVNGELPLARGRGLTVQQERRLGIPQPSPGDLERARKKSEAAHAELQEALSEAKTKR